MVRKVARRVALGSAACLPLLLAAGLLRGADEEIVVATPAAPRPPYRIVLRSRGGEVLPRQYKDGYAAGGYIDVVQRAPDEVVTVLRGAVVAGAEQCKGGSASMHFELCQDFDVVATRAAVRPPRLVLAGMLVGILQSTEKYGGSAAQGPACASVSCGEQPILHFCIKPHGVTTAQKLFVNDRDGCEQPVVPGCFSLHETFDLSAEQPWPHCHLGAAAGAVFDPDPRLPARWAPVIRPTQGVPTRDFGFTVTLHVEEERLPPGASAAEPLPPPRKAGDGPRPPADAKGAEEDFPLPADARGPERP